MLIKMYCCVKICRITDSDGRCSQLFAAANFTEGTYRVHFDTCTYFSLCGNKNSFYPYAEVSRIQVIIVDTTFFFVSCRLFLL